MPSSPDPAGFACPLPLSDYPRVTLAHGGGGKLMNQLIEDMFLTCFAPDGDSPPHDGARLDLGSGKVAFTTDSYVVSPLFFPGGSIATLAVNGTVNDLLMCGAKPRYLSTGFVLEEGLPMETLWRVVREMAQAAEQAGVRIVTGDTKVVDRGRGDGVYINTAGIGTLQTDLLIGPESLRTGDRILLSGDLGRHGIAVMATREGLEFETAIESDCAPLLGPVLELLEAGIEVHCLRDLTRGGLVSALNELASGAGVEMAILEEAIPLQEEVRGACELLGLDPLSVANEGRFIAVVPPGEERRALEVLRRHEVSSAARCIGEVQSAREGRGWVWLKTRIGASRILPMPSGEQLPRIC